MEDKFFENYINYETKMTQIFSELQLKPNHRHLIRAFIMVSDGQTEFEASFSELEALTNKTGKSERKTANVRNALRTLLEWQDENRIELIRVVKKGERIPKNGVINYKKSKYKFILLSDLARVIHADSERFKTVFDELIAKIRSDFKPTVKARKYYPLHSLQRARKTVVTKIKRVFELSKEAGINPVIECKRVLNNALKMFKDLEIEETYRENRESFITEFESLLGWREPDEDLEAVTE